MKPTSEERKIACKVLDYYWKIANDVLQETDQERPSEWVQGAEVWVELLSDGDPEVDMLEYLEEYRAGHSKDGDED